MIALQAEVSDLTPSYPEQQLNPFASGNYAYSTSRRTLQTGKATRTSLAKGLERLFRKVSSEAPQLRGHIKGVFESPDPGVLVLTAEFTVRAADDQPAFDPFVMKGKWTNTAPSRVGRNDRGEEYTYHDIDSYKEPLRALIAKAVEESLARLAAYKPVLDFAAAVDVRDPAQGTEPTSGKTD